MLEYCDRLHFKTGIFCVLCHKRLPEPQYESRYELPQSKAWEYKVLGFCDIANSNNRPSVVTIPADLTAPGTFSELSVSIKSGRSFAIKFCLESECGSCKEGKIAHLVHLSCWQWIRQSNKNYTSLSIYKLARSTYPIYELEDAADGEDSMTIDFSNSTNRTRVDTIIGRGLRIFSRLPAEIRSMISAHFVRNLSLSLLAGSETSCMLLNIIDRSRSDVIELECNTMVGTLYSKSISVWGSSYISSLRFHNTKGISVNRSDIKGVRFMVGPYGLRALSILYSDDSTSAWLGEPTNGWFGVIYGTDISRLQVLKDDLKCLRINIDSVDTRSVTETRVMWDKDLRFTSTQSHHILETISTRRQIQNFPEWRLCRYLPFLDDGCYISGLTMYCHGHSITGMIAYGQSRKLVGSCQGCPIHFCLQPNERIVSVWLRMPVNHFNIESDPNVLVTTNYNRSCIFGPSLLSSTIQERQYAWTCLNKESGPDIIGIFYDALSMRPLNKIANVGITQDINPGHSFAKQELPRIPVAWRRPRMLANEVTGLYLSIGTLSLVQSLRVRRVGLRLMGVSISHDDSSIDVLGQWDDCQSSSISEIYNSSDGVLTSITFRFCGESRASYADGIFVGVNGVDAVQHLDAGTFKTFSIKKLNSPAISWWFSEFYDHIEPWRGQYQEVNVSPESYKTVDLR